MKRLTVLGKLFALGLQGGTLQQQLLANDGGLPLQGFYLLAQEVLALGLLLVCPVDDGCLNWLKEPGKLPGGFQRLRALAHLVFSRDVDRLDEVLIQMRSEEHT